VSETTFWAGAAVRALNRTSRVLPPFPSLREGGVAPSLNLRSSRNVAAADQRRLEGRLPGLSFICSSAFI